jgi:transcriptional regulator with XRE-family HTH domain
MTVRQLAAQIGVSHSTVSKWENAVQVPDLESVVAYLQACGVTGQARERVLQLVRGTTDPNWLAGGLQDASEGLMGVLECERLATEIDEWSPLLVPGLLQTPDYARAILGTDPTLSPKELDALVAVRIGRRENLTKVRDEETNLGPADYTALISENALRERVGGNVVLSEQLRYLLELAKLPTVTILVIRARQDWHPGLSGPFILYRFAEAPPIVHIEHHRSSAFLYEVDDILAYKAAATVIRRRALSAEDSSAFIGEVINEVEKA